MARPTIKRRRGLKRVLGSNQDVVNAAVQEIVQEVLGAERPQVVLVAGPTGERLARRAVNFGRPLRSIGPAFASGCGAPVPLPQNFPEWGRLRHNHDPFHVGLF